MATDPISAFFKAASAIAVSLFLALTLFAGAASARPHPVKFIKAHKVLLITSALFIAADIADTRTSIDVQQRCPTCVETSDLYGPHPSPARLWGESAALDAGYVWFDWFGTKESGLTGTKDFTPEDRAKHPVLYKLCWMERPAAVAILATVTAGHARAAYLNAQIK